MKNLLVLEIPTNEAREPKNRMQIQLETPRDSDTVSVFWDKQDEDERQIIV